MTKSIRMILTPFLIISYVFGLRIASLSRNYSKLWFSFLYMMLIWLVYYFLATSWSIYSIIKSYRIEYNIWYLLELFTTLLSVIFNVYYDKVKKQ